jgi:Flagellar basal body-associated protein
MSDQDDINLEGGEAAAGDAGGKKGGGLIPQLLKWVAIALGALVFIVTVVVITVNIMGGSGKNQTAVPLSEEYQGIREALTWYPGVGLIQTRTTDDNPVSVVVDVQLGYAKDDKTTPNELAERIVELKDFLRSYFQHKTGPELRNEEKIKIEIRNSINDNILSGSKIKDVKFIRYEIVGE